MITSLKEIYSYREMLFSLVRRDLRGRYKGSVLGFLWTFLNPLLQLVVYTIVFSIILPTDIEKYYLHLFVALVPWIFFSTSLTGGAGCILAQQEMVKKIYFPREILPLSYVVSQFVNMLLSFLVVFLVIIGTGHEINVAAFCCLPVVMAVEFILALGVAMLASAVTVYIRDLEYILGILVLAWQFLTPVMYPVSIVPEKMMWLFHLNPMTSVTEAYRQILYYARVPQLGTLTNVILTGIIVLAIGWVSFARLKKGFAEEL